jgi:hypothetical protein
VAAKGVLAGTLPSLAMPATPLSGPALGEAAAGAVGDGCCNGVPPGQPSWIPGPKQGERAAGSSGSGRNGPPVPSPPRCGAVSPAPPPGPADGDDSDCHARAAARGDASNGDPLGNNDAATATVAGKADNAGQENNDHSSDDGDDNKNNDKWGRGA